MGISKPSIKHIAMALVFTGFVTTGTGRAGQSGRSGDHPGEAAAVQPSAPSPSGDEIFAQLVRQNKLRSARLTQYSEERVYTVASPNGKVHARITGRMESVGPNQKQFVTTSEEGSSLIRHMALRRLIQHELSVAAGKEHRDTSIVPENYSFTLLGQEAVADKSCYVVAAHPKRKDGYLFEGKIWVDSRQFAIVKITGHPTKSLSFWVTHVEFVRQYEEFGGFWLPTLDETFMSVRLYGKKVLTIEHHLDTVNGEKATAGVARNPNSAAASELHQFE
jgi:hypothetical protein